MCECADGLKGIYQTENYPKTVKRLKKKRNASGKCCLWTLNWFKWSSNGVGLQWPRKSHWSWLQSGTASKLSETTSTRFTGKKGKM